MVPTPIISSTNGSTYSKVVSKRTISSFAQRVTRNENIAKKQTVGDLGAPWPKNGRQWYLNLPFVLLARPSVGLAL